MIFWNYFLLYLIKLLNNIVSLVWRQIVPEDSQILLLLEVLLVLLEKELLLSLLVELRLVVWVALQVV